MFNKVPASEERLRCVEGDRILNITDGMHGVSVRFENSPTLVFTGGDLISVVVRDQDGSSTFNSRAAGMIVRRVSCSSDSFVLPHERDGKERFYSVHLLGECMDGKPRAVNIAPGVLRSLSQGPQMKAYVRARGNDNLLLRLIGI